MIGHQPDKQLFVEIIATFLFIDSYSEQRRAQVTISLSSMYAELAVAAIARLTRFQRGSLLQPERSANIHPQPP